MPDSRFMILRGTEEVFFLEEIKFLNCRVIYVLVFQLIFGKYIMASVKVKSCN
jgi:hypothetical protein